MTKNDQRIFFDLLRAEKNKILYIVLAFLISFILTAIFKTQFLEITTFALLAVIAIWAMSQEHKDKKLTRICPYQATTKSLKKGVSFIFKLLITTNVSRPLKIIVSLMKQ